MTEKSKTLNDTFTFSLRGARCVNAFAIAPAVRHDRINDACDARCRDQQEDVGSDSGPYEGVIGRYWLQRRRRAA